MKKCVNCGAELEDAAQFCPSCGANQNAAAEPKKEEVKKESPFAPANKSGKGMNKVVLIAIIAAAAVVVVLLITLLVSAFTGYKKPIKNYYKAYNTELGLSKAFLLPAEYEASAGKVTYSIEDKKKISKSKLEDLADSFEDDYDEEYKFSKGYIVEVSTRIEYEDEDRKDSKDDVYFVIVKKGSKWYVYDVDYSSDDIDDVIDRYVD